MPPAEPFDFRDEPPTKRKASAAWSRKRVLIVLAAALAVAIAAGAVISMRSRPGGGGGLGGAVALTVTAETLFQDYSFSNRNPAAADAKYKDRVLEVTGRVLEVERRGDEAYYVGIETGPNVMIDGRVLRAAVVFRFPTAKRSEIARLNKFDVVTMRGECRGCYEERGRMGGVIIPLDLPQIISHTPHK